MNTSNQYDLAQLAEAAYADLLNDFDEQITDKDDFVKSLKLNGFSYTQAGQLADHWEVVHHQPNTDNGFSGTVFRRIDDDPLSGFKAGDLIFALRGTEGAWSLDLWQADINEIVGNGLAFSHIIDMYNYWQCLITPVGELAKQAALVLAPSDTPPEKIITSNGMKYTIDFVNSGTGLGRVSLDDNVFAATGHSLGGHLATAFTRVFSNWATHAVTINGAGYPTGLTPGLARTAADNIQ